MGRNSRVTGSSSYWSCKQARSCSSGIPGCLLIAHFLSFLSVFFPFHSSQSEMLNRGGTCDLTDEGVIRICGMYRPHPSANLLLAVCANSDHASYALARKTEQEAKTMSMIAHCKQW